MAARSALLVVEGPQDAEIIARLLKPDGFARIRELQRLPPEWHPLVPRSFPASGDLLARHPVPLFLNLRQEWVLALVRSGGVERVASRLNDSLRQLSFRPDSVGVIVDADDVDPVKRHQDIVRALGALGAPGEPVVRFPGLPGTVTDSGGSRTGVFVAPNNVSRGSIDVLLVEGAERSYPSLLAHARSYVENVPESGLDGDDLSEIRKPFGATKATLHALTAILKPGMAIQNSIQSHRWLEGEAAKRPLAMGLASFLHALLGRPEDEPKPNVSDRL
jgi:hypothetical protein